VGKKREVKNIEGVGWGNKEGWEKHSRMGKQREGESRNILTEREWGYGNRGERWRGRQYALFLCVFLALLLLLAAW
jgi:hypothetical protein